MVSIIVPVYNVERYLPRCIESILKQTYKEFELILVDDGSADKSGKICDSYARKDARIKVIHKENGGVSDARNLGIEHSSGRYISFIDSDDWVEDNYLETLMKITENNDAQISIGTYDFRDLKVTFLPESPYDSIDFKKPIFKNCILFFDGWLRYGPCAKIFCRDIIMDNNIKFNSTIKHGEDTLFVNEYLSKCNKIHITNDIIYHYNRLVEGSATKKFYNDYADWNLIIVDSLVKLLDAVNLSDAEKNQILDIIVIGRTCNIVSGYVKNLHYGDAISRIDDVIDKFGKWILAEQSTNDAADSRQKVKQAIRTKDSELIYREQKKLLDKNKIRKIVKGIIYKISIPIIERVRDEIVIFKE